MYGFIGCRRKVWNGSGTEFPCTFETSGSMRMAALGPAPQECHHQTFAKAGDEISATTQPKIACTRWYIPMGLPQ